MEKCKNEPKLFLWVDCIYLDLKKALDKVPHKKLFWKLENVGGLREG